MSHPVWVRGLKLALIIATAAAYQSHPVWVRGLKLDEVTNETTDNGRTPCGCVD